MKQKNNHNGEPQIENAALNLFKAAQTVHMTADEKARGRARLMAFIDAEQSSSTADASGAIPTPYSQLPTPPHRSLIQILDLREYVFSHKVAAFLVVLTILVISGKGMVIAAKKSVPGSAFYPFKIYTYEKVQSLLALNPQANAEVDVEHATVRLQEAEILAAEGKLDTTTEAQVTAGFKASADLVTAKAKRFRDSGDVDAAALISSDLESSLASHKSVLGKLKAVSAIASSTLNPLINLVDTSLSSTTEDRASSENLIATSSDMNILKAAAKQARDNSRNRFEQASRFIKTAENQSADIKKAAADQLKTAQDFMNEGNDNFNNGKYSDAYLLYGKAGRNAGQASLEVRLHGAVNPNK